MSNIERYSEKLRVIRQAGSYRSLHNLEHNGFLINDSGEELLNLTSNDYLGLASNPNLLEDFHRKLDVKSMTFSASSSRLLSGNHAHYALLEEDLADLYGKEAALVFNSGYHANIGILPALAGKRDLIVADKAVDASITDGMRLCEAELMRFNHLEYEDLRYILSRERERFENVFIVSEAIFGMSGDVADLQQLCEIKREYDTFLYIDEAHAVGVRGTNGLGLCEEQGCIDEIDFITGSFGKALASVGAYLVCSELFREYLVNTQRTLIYATALPPINVAWTRYVLNRLPEFYEMRVRLADLADELREVLHEKGFVTTGDSHIIPMVCGENEAAVEMYELLRSNGFYAMPVHYPTVPKGKAMIRFSLNAAIPDEEYSCLVDFLRCLE